MGESTFVQVAEKADGDIMELPVEDDGTVLLSTLQAQFPTAVGLKYKSSSGGWRGVRAADKALDAPHEGWEDTIFVITESKALKRAASDTVERAAVSKVRKTNLLDDIIVLGVPYTTTAEEFEKYFADKCGDLAFHELKHDRQTKKSRGFGFIRFKTEEAAKEALHGKHYIEGRKLELRMSKQQETNPTKLFIGRLPEGSTSEDLRTHFSEYGELVDVFVSTPFRGFGFVTYSSQDDAADALRDSHTLKGTTLNVTAAEPKGAKDKSAGGPMNNGTNYGGRPETPVKLFIARVPHGINHQEVNEYFSKFGKLSDVFVPSPFRGFCFVTFSYQEDAMRALNMNHTLQGAMIHVKPAEPKEGRTPQENIQQSKSGNYVWDPSNRAGQAPQEVGYQQVGYQVGPPAQKDATSEIKDLLLTLLNKR